MSERYRVLEWVNTPITTKQGLADFKAVQEHYRKTLGITAKVSVIRALLREKALELESPQEEPA